MPRPSGGGDPLPRAAAIRRHGVVCVACMLHVCEEGRIRLLAAGPRRALPDQFRYHYDVWAQHYRVFSTGLAQIGTSPGGIGRQPPGGRG